MSTAKRRRKAPRRRSPGLLRGALGYEGDPTSSDLDELYEQMKWQQDVPPSCQEAFRFGARVGIAEQYERCEYEFKAKCDERVKEERDDCDTRVEEAENEARSSGQDEGREACQEDRDCWMDSCESYVSDHQDSFCPELDCSDCETDCSDSCPCGDYCEDEIDEARKEGREESATVFTERTRVKHLTKIRDLRKRIRSSLDRWSCPQAFKFYTQLRSLCDHPGLVGKKPGVCLEKPYMKGKEPNTWELFQRRCLRAAPGEEIEAFSGARRRRRRQRRFI